MKLADEKMYSVEYGMRENVRKILVLISDGKDNQPQTTTPLLKAVKDKGMFKLQREGPQHLWMRAKSVLYQIIIFLFA